MARSYLPSLFGRGDETLGSLFRDVEKVFEEFSRRPPFAFSAEPGTLAGPKIDVAVSKDTAELPGVEEKDIELTLANGLLTIRGEKKTERDEKDTNKNWHVIERSYGAFSRSIALPFEPASDKVEAPEVASKQQRIEIKKG